MSMSFLYFGSVASAMITDELIIRGKYQHDKYPILSSNRCCPTSPDFARCLRRHMSLDKNS
uniref:SFRICE_016616 n=1 Tax=Spodoptera frugiperda TaxID=7108 RepID=A0A2H1VF64_SPOFR